MNIIFKPLPVPQKFAVGDHVVCSGQVCRVVAVGLRYLRLESLDGLPLGLVKTKAVASYDAVNDDSPLLQFTSAEVWNPDTLLRRKR